MPHRRKRYLVEGIEKALGWAPTISLLGMRQVGKTTLLRGICQTYLTLDDDHVALRFQEGDWSALESGARPLALDECQKAPGLFDRIKLIVDRAPRPGQFILTGSVRFLSKRQIRESLTGRTAIFELLPMTLSEGHELPPSRFLEALLKQKPSSYGRFLDSLNSKRPRFKAKECSSYLETGGLPGIAFKRDRAIRNELWNTQLETLLSRDIRQLYPTDIPYSRLRSLFTELARQQGLPCNHSQLARRIGVSAPTVKQLLAAFEGLFLIREVGKTYYCEDQGLASHVLGDSEQAGLFQLRRLVFQEVFSQLIYRFRGSFTFSDYSTRGGVHIPFLISVREREPLAIAVDETDGASEKTLKSLTWFKKRHPRAGALVVLHQGARAYQASSGALCIPFQWLF